MPDATVTNGTARILWVQSPSKLLKFPPLVTVIVAAEDVEPVGYALVGPFAPFVADGSVTYQLPTFEDHRGDPPPVIECPAPTPPTLPQPGTPIVSPLPELPTPTPLPELPETPPTTARRR